ncbi:MAG: hypothetical protein BAA04_02645 [Firmicutes bacterium ZCTH02-B6]|nr:MAG: hypothetical protein BAA04_02645 [Firmicutes bacterium ZCTH02-B6]
MTAQNPARANGAHGQAWWERRAEDVERLISRYPKSRSALMGLLWMAQEERGWVAPEDMEYIAQRLGISRAYVESTCSFYSLYHRKPVGRYVITVCGNIMCGLSGAEALIRHFEQRLGIKLGETTADGLFTLLVTGECVAACDGAPAVQINEEYFHKVTPERADQIVQALRDGADLVELSERIGLIQPGAVWEAGESA